MAHSNPGVEFDEDWEEPEPITEEQWEGVRQQFYFACWGYTAWLALILGFLLSGDPS